MSIQQLLLAGSGAGGSSFSQISWLLHGNGTDGSTTITDSSSYARTTTANGNAQIDTAQFKFGGASILFDGAGDTVTASASSEFDFGAGDWTVEAWMRFSAANNWGFYRTNDARLLIKGDANRWVLQVNGATNVFVVGWTPTLAQWYHVAICRVGSATRIFIDGVELSNGLSTNVTGHTNTGPIVGEADGSRFMNGWIDDIRITKGFGWYSAPFTPPTAQFPDS